MTRSFDLDAYLHRLRYEGPREPTFETLRSLCELQPACIPFENIDPFLGRPPDLSIDAVQAKLVARRRGGYCYELNLLLRAALLSLGMQVTGLAARVVWMRPLDAPLRARSHTGTEGRLARPIRRLVHRGCRLRWATARARRCVSSPDWSRKHRRAVTGSSRRTANTRSKRRCPAGGRRATDSDSIPFCRSTMSRSTGERRHTRIRSSRTICCSSGSRQACARRCSTTVFQSKGPVTAFALGASRPQPNTAVSSRRYSISRSLSGPTELFARIPKGLTDPTCHKPEVDKPTRGASR